MDEADAAELRNLRERAYGRGGDLADDPAALQRLAELGDRQRTEQRRVDQLRAELQQAERSPAGLSQGEQPRGGPSRGGPSQAGLSQGERSQGERVGQESERGWAEWAEWAPERRTARAGEADGGVGSHSGESGEQAGPTASADLDPRHSEGATGDDDAGPAITSVGRRPVRRVFVGVAWVASLALVAAVTASVTAWSTARTAATATTIRDDADITYVTTLLPDSSRDVPDIWGSGDPESDGVVYDTFFGLVAASSKQTWASVEAECLFITAEEEIERADAESSSGLATVGGCTQSAFPAAAQFVMGEFSQMQVPDELSSRYPPDTAFQFVLHDLGVDVFISTPAGSSTVESSTEQDARTEEP